MSQARFITFEGGEGVGKSTQVKRLRAQLTRKGISCLATREPGGSVGAEALRDLLMGEQLASLCPEAQTYVFHAARMDHLVRTIRPALAQGSWVICDRFADSTRVYQGVMQGVASSLLNELEAITLGNTKPDLTFILDLPAVEGLARVEARRHAAQQTGPLDRFERADIHQHEALREAFREIARREPERCHLIDAARSEEEIAQEIWQLVEAHEWS